MTLIILLFFLAIDIFLGVIGLVLVNLAGNLIPTLNLSKDLINVFKILFGVWWLVIFIVFSINTAGRVPSPVLCSDGKKEFSGHSGKRSD